MAEEKEKKKPRVPTAQKRELQNSKRRLRNKAFKSSVRTAVRNFEEVAKTGDQAQATQLLNEVYSLMDKGVKKGIYKLNKAGRTKSRLAAHAVSKA
ncbi:MAG: 30S ribosomal protein S20 [Parachlamydia sp.]|nr:MAG: 30S ribosomal protein S20 [Parachlamydia sp.]